LKIKEFNKEKYGVEYYSQTIEYTDKFKTTMLERYGVEYALQNKELKEKANKTNLEKFGYINPFMDNKKIRNDFLLKHGVDHPSKVDYMYDKIRTKNENSKHWIHRDSRSEFLIYRNKIRNLTKQNIKKLEWNGHDYYDNEYILYNFKFHHNDYNYPTIDHKISIYEGYKNGISIEDIADVSNLCWTKRIINSRKSKNSLDN
jgi:hypothetical protein